MRAELSPTRHKWRGYGSPQWSVSDSTVVSLTELPEGMVHQEMNEILQLSGHESESLTLDQLRLAMLSYLESFQADLADETDQVMEHDADQFKTPLFLSN